MDHTGGMGKFRAKGRLDGLGPACPIAENPIVVI